MKNKHLVIWLVALAWITIQVHNVVPHHHHDKYAATACSHTCEHHSSEKPNNDHQHDHNDQDNEESSCNFAQNEIMTEQQGFIFILPEIPVEKIIVPENTQKEFHFIEPDITIEDIYLCTSGLRAPPSLA